MTGRIIVMAGLDRVDLPALHFVAAEFGWGVEVAHHLQEVVVAQAHRQIAALLFHRGALGPGYSWLETIRLLREALPKVPLVACYGFAERIDWPKLSDAGVFHALWLPLRENEVRQSLGFIWEAEKRLSVPAEGLPAIISVRKAIYEKGSGSRRSRRRHARMRTRAAG